MRLCNPGDLAGGPGPAGLAARFRSNSADVAGGHGIGDGGGDHRDHDQESAAGLVRISAGPATGA